MPIFETLSKAKSEKEILGIEGINAYRYWNTLTHIIKDNFPEWKYEGRTHENGRSMNADCELNALFNFGYKLLEAVLRKALNGVGLDTAIGFIHEIKPSREPLVYDMQEPFRFLIDFLIFDALEKHIFNPKKDFYHTREYIYRLNDRATATFIQLFDNVMSGTVKYKNLNQIWVNVIQRKCGELAKDIEKQSDINMTFPTFVKTRTDNKDIRELILKQSCTETAKKGLSKGTLYYRKKKVESGLPLKIYKARAKYDMNDVGEL